MSRSTIMKVGGFITTIAASAALVAAAAGSTGAYFSDTKSGAMTGTSGSIKIVTAGGAGEDSLDLSFQGLLPGEVQSKKVTYYNSGHSTQDVWVVFDAEDLAGLNDLGRFGEVHLLSDDTEIFASKNLNDNKGGGCSELDSSGTPTGCKPLHAMYKLKDSVAPGDGGSMTFGFGIDDATVGHQDSPWLALGYQLVATQHGIAPGAVATLG